jgi:hypothetical protein
VRRVSGTALPRAYSRPEVSEPARKENLPQRILRRGLEEITNTRLWIYGWRPRVQGTMTIPDIGHCAGSGSAPLEGTIRGDGDERSGVCGACSRRFDLREDGTLSFHRSIGEVERDAEGRREGAARPGSD